MVFWKKCLVFCLEFLGRDWVFSSCSRFAGSWKSFLWFSFSFSYISLLPKRGIFLVLLVCEFLLPECCNSQCRQKTMEFMAPCRNHGQKKQCSFHFCHICLLNRSGFLSLFFVSCFFIFMCWSWAFFFVWVSSDMERKGRRQQHWMTGNVPSAEAFAIVVSACKFLVFLHCGVHISICRFFFSWILIDGPGNWMFRKKRGHIPTGILVHTAKATGFSSVSEMLQLKGSEVLYEDEGTSLTAPTEVW